MSLIPVRSQKLGTTEPGKEIAGMKITSNDDARANILLFLKTWLCIMVVFWGLTGILCWTVDYHHEVSAPVFSAWIWDGSTERSSWELLLHAVFGKGLGTFIGIFINNLFITMLLWFMGTMFLFAPGFEEKPKRIKLHMVVVAFMAVAILLKMVLLFGYIIIIMSAFAAMDWATWTIGISEAAFMCWAVSFFFSPLISIRKGFLTMTSEEAVNKFRVFLEGLPVKPMTYVMIGVVWGAAVFESISIIY